MRGSVNDNLKKRTAPLVWILIAVLAMIVPVMTVLADPVPGCSNCSCSGNGSCSGCQDAVQGFMVYYITVPSDGMGGPLYNFCDSPGVGTCFTQTVDCYTLPAGMTVNYNMTPPCQAPYTGKVTGPAFVTEYGCIPGQGG